MTDIQIKIVCPDCQNQIVRPKSMEVGDILECETCGTEVEVTSLEPLAYRELLESK